MFVFWAFSLVNLKLCATVKKLLINGNWSILIGFLEQFFLLWFALPCGIICEQISTCHPFSCIFQCSKLYQCKTCNKKFQYLAAFNSHERIHNGEYTSGGKLFKIFSRGERIRWYGEVIRTPNKEDYVEVLKIFRPIPTELLAPSTPRASHGTKIFG